MCEENPGVIRRIVSTIFSGSASTAVKASPGLVVSSLSFAGIPIETWVTILTAAYVLFMCIGALPRVVETLRFFWRLFRPKTADVLVVTEVESGDVQRKIDKVKGHE